MSDARHWDAVYARRGESAVSWFEDRPALSLELIARHAEPGDSVIDVGGGAARLVDHLARAGGRELAVLDLSARALEMGRERLGPKADSVDWIATDVSRWRPARRWRLWHDRAVFHFLTEPAARAGYMRALLAALEPGGSAIVATFAPDGPETCSDLPVRRYAPPELLAEFERLAPGRFALAEARAHVHVSPGGMRQNFQVSVLRRVGGRA